ncbi:MAG: alcohol dehydrogenase catalytic domain-containing protein [Actinobacteria bacterium]|nr:alcohol dehydrogenase catalytic domain-containing protein [Actinomycetota bacterium]
MKALVVTEPNRFSVEEVEQPEPGPFELLCRVRAVTICGTDAHLLRGDYPGFWPPSYPFIPGHEWSGEVVEVGPGAELLGWSVGDRVAGTSHDACGFCQKCVEGRYNLCENYGNTRLHRQYGHNWQGSFAEYVVHGVKSVFHLPDALTFSEGATLDPASIALHTANRGGNRPGDTVVVIGPGPVGLLAADAARARGAGRVIVAGRGGRLAKAADLGNETVDVESEDPVRAIRNMTDGLGADVILECAGVPQTLQWSLAMARKGGRIAVVGIPVAGVELALQDLVLYEYELVGVRASAGEMRHVIPLVVDGRIRVRELITHHFALDDFATALQTFNERRDGALKVIVEP